MGGHVPPVPPPPPPPTVPTPMLYQIGHLTDQDKYFDPKYVVRS